MSWKNAKKLDPNAKSEDHIEQYKKFLEDNKDKFSRGDIYHIYMSYNNNNSHKSGDDDDDFYMADRISSNASNAAPDLDKYKKQVEELQKQYKTSVEIILQELERTNIRNRDRGNRDGNRDYEHNR